MLGQLFLVSFIVLVFSVWAGAYRQWSWAKYPGVIAFVVAVFAGVGWVVDRVTTNFQNLAYQMVIVSLLLGGSAQAQAPTPERAATSQEVEQRILRLCREQIVRPVGAAVGISANFQPTMIRATAEQGCQNLARQLATEWQDRQ